jgi:type II secretory pathway pseudopilin PulG
MLTKTGGFSFAELLIGTAIMSIAMLGVLSVVDQVGAQEKALKMRRNINALTSQLEARTMFSATCGETIRSAGDPNQRLQIDPAAVASGTQNFDIGARIPNIRGVSGSDFISSDASANNLDLYNLRVREVRVNDVQDISGLPLGDPGLRTFLGVLEVGFDTSVSAASFLGNRSYRNVTVGPVFLVTDPNAGNEIVNCYSASKSETPKELCETLDGTWSSDTCRLPIEPLTCPLGFFPTVVKDGAVRCDRLGTAQGCPPGYGVVAMGLEQQVCAPLPIVYTNNLPSAGATVPAPSSCTGTTPQTYTAPNIYTAYDDCLRARPNESYRCVQCPTYLGQFTDQLCYRLQIVGAGVCP